MDKINYKTKILIAIELLIITVLLAIISFLIFNKPNDNTIVQSNNGDKNSNENDIHLTSAEMKDISRVTSFLTIYGKEQVNLSQDKQARVQFIEWTAINADEGALEDVRYIKINVLEDAYKKVFGRNYYFDEDTDGISEAILRDCSNIFGEGYSCFDDAKIDGSIFFELDDPEISGENGNIILTGKGKLFRNLEENKIKYHMEYKDYHLVNLITSYL